MHKGISSSARRLYREFLARRRALDRLFGAFAPNFFFGMSFRDGLPARGGCTVFVRLGPGGTFGRWKGAWANALAEITTRRITARRTMRENFMAVNRQFLLISLRAAEPCSTA
jgi:hypothetical protein